MVSKSLVERICEWCGADFLAPKYDVEKRGGGRFCCRACYEEWYKTKHWMVDVVCLNCGKPFVVVRASFERGEGKYCSPDCFLTALRERRRKPTNFSCQQCGTAFEASVGPNKKPPRFCSTSCVVAHRNSRVSCGERAKKSHKPRGKIDTACSWCGKGFKATPRPKKHTGPRFCCRECYAAHRSHNIRGERSPSWTGGPVGCVCLHCGNSFFRSKSAIENGSGKFCCMQCYSEHYVGERHPCYLGNPREYPPGWNEGLRGRIRERDGHVCFLCGGRGKRALSIHHIDYNRNNLSLNNLIALCDPCHNRTNNDRHLWTQLLSDMVMERYGYGLQEDAA